MSSATDNHRSVAAAAISWSKAIFTPLALVFLGYFFWTSRDALISIYSGGSLVSYSIVILCWIVLHCISPLFTGLALRSLGISLDYGTAMRIHISRLPAKYLPGGVWHSVARAADYRLTGMESKQILGYLVMENLITVAVALGIGGIFAMQAASQPVALVIGIGATMAWALLLLMPRLRRLAMASGEPLSKTAYFSSILVIAAYWCLAGASFSVYISAFPNLQVSTGPVMSGGIYLFSWAVGYLAVFAPQGLGVAEAVSGLLLGGQMDLGSMIIVLLGFRLLMAVADIASWIAYCLVFRGRVS
jgi:hypothetical protein